MALQAMFQQAANPFMPENPIEGGGDGKKKNQPAGLTYDQINKWSDYVEANPSKDLSALYAGFSAKNPGHGIDLNVLRGELDKLKAGTIKNATETGSDLGSAITTGFSFPKMQVDGKDYGRVNSMMQTQTQPPMPQQIREDLLVQKLPNGIKEEDVWFDSKQNVVKFIDPETGDVKMASRSLLNHPTVRKSMERMKADLDARRGQAQVQPNPLSGNN